MRPHCDCWEYPLEEPNATSNYYVEHEVVVVTLQRMVDGENNNARECITPYGV